LEIETTRKLIKDLQPIENRNLMFWGVERHNHLCIDVNYLGTTWIKVMVKQKETITKHKAMAQIDIVV
jgi:hypothetical protein